MSDETDEKHPTPFSYTGDNWLVSYNVIHEDDGYLIQENTYKPKTDALEASNIKDRMWWMTTLQFGPFETFEETEYRLSFMTAVWREHVNQALEVLYEKELEDE